jgi:hypothetical protein
MMKIKMAVKRTSINILVWINWSKNGVRTSISNSRISRVRNLELCTFWMLYSKFIGDIPAIAFIGC